MDLDKEEKEAIEYIKAFQKDLYGASEKNLMAIYIDRVWNYIDKLQKENTSLKKEIKLMKSVNINENFINKEIIRNKIKELEELRDEAITWKLWHIFNSNIYILEELLGDDFNE